MSIATSDGARYSGGAEVGASRLRRRENAWRSGQEKPWNSVPVPFGHFRLRWARNGPRLGGHRHLCRLVFDPAALHVHAHQFTQVPDLLAFFQTAAVAVVAPAVDAAGGADDPLEFTLGVRLQSDHDSAGVFQQAGPGAGGERDGGEFDIGRAEFVAIDL